MQGVDGAEKPPPKGQGDKRGGARASGTKVQKPKKTISTGIEGPLSGLTFVFTGVLESLDRQQSQDLVKSLGARVTTAVSGRTDFLVHGNLLEDGREFTKGNKY